VEEDQDDGGFAPHSPWSAPPIHRPAPRTETDRWTRREVTTRPRTEDPPPIAPAPLAPKVEPPIARPAPKGTNGQLYQAPRVEPADPDERRRLAVERIDRE